jgi:opacity protein-like surface antigen
LKEPPIGDLAKFGGTRIAVTPSIGREMTVVRVDRNEEVDMKRLATMVVMLSSMILVTAISHAEKPWTVELRAGAGPSQEVEGDALGPGMGFEAALAYRFLPHLSAYGGWDWYHFTSDQTFAGSDMDFEETGYAFGLKFEHPFSGEQGPGPSWWVRGGGTYEHIEIENPDGDIIGDSGHGIGWETGAGVSFQVAESWWLTPGARYRSLTRDVTLSGVTRSMDLRYLAVEIGVARSF